MDRLRISQVTRQPRRFIADSAISSLLVFLCTLPFCSALDGQPASSAGALSPSQWLQTAACAADLGERYASVTNVKYRASFSEGSAVRFVGDDAVVKKYHDGDREHIILNYSGAIAPNGIYMTNLSRHQTLLAGGSRISWWFPSDRPLIGTVQVARAPDLVKSMKLVDDCDTHAGAFLDGAVDGLGSIFDIAGAGTLSVRIQQENFAGIPCEVIESTTASGHASLWIAPSEGNNLVKYVLDVISGSHSPLHTEFEARAFKNIDGRVLISAGQTQDTWVDTASKNPWQDTTQADRVLLDLHPEFAEANVFTTNDIPDGIRVLLDDLPNVGIHFIWMHGKPVAKFDEALFTDLKTSLQKTDAGQIQAASPAPQHADSIAGIEDGRHRMMQSCIALFAAAAIMLAMLLGIYLRRGISHAAH